MMIMRRALALRTVRSVRHYLSKPTLYYRCGPQRREVFPNTSSVMVATVELPSGAQPRMCEHRYMHTSCRNPDEAAHQARPQAVADALLSQWSRRGGTEPTGPSPRRSTAEDGLASSFTPEALMSLSPAAETSGYHVVHATAGGQAPLSSPVAPNAAVAPPSVEDLFAEVDEEDTDTPSFPVDPVAEGKARDVFRDDLPYSTAPLQRTGASSFVSSASLEGLGLEDTSSTAPSPSVSATSAAEAALLEAALQHELSESLNSSVDDSSDEGSNEMEEVATILVADPDPIASSPRPFTDAHHHSAEMQRAAHVDADVDDADSELDVKIESSEDAVDDEESMESVLEEESERMYHAALKSMARDQGISGEGDASRCAFSNYTFFSKSAVAAAVESLSASASVVADKAASSFGPSDRYDDAASVPATEFDDDAAREAEIESVGDDMTTSGASAVAAVKQ
ncbi:hypothetical protein JKF63_02249 [Porcisia hertigi]|uniref:Uncharacterized protein n=1 Tax=Porcisia hertigi TaxID=2761500 RepID=A0A836HLX7_9TRYP|nr:hypothetical protein JKF63_02249 [Porcisia hertigi]